ncbi:MAG: hypothetical protein M9894_11875 [Planctomycetes bacterium]|nr:hypothetical protein [Planctomycetota bacterium]
MIGPEGAPIWNCRLLTGADDVTLLDPAERLIFLLIFEISSTHLWRSRWVRSRISSLDQWKWYARYADSWYSRSSG